MTGKAKSGWALMGLAVLVIGGATTARARWHAAQDPAHVKKSDRRNPGAGE